MSCWKCGQELPEGETECEGRCISQAERELMALVPKQRVFEMTLVLDTQKAEADPAALAEAVMKFKDLIKPVLVESGIAKFLQSPPDNSQPGGSR